MPLHLSELQGFWILQCHPKMSHPTLTWHSLRFSHLHIVEECLKPLGLTLLQVISQSEALGSFSQCLHSLCHCISGHIHRPLTVIIILLKRKTLLNIVHKTKELFRVHHYSVTRILSNSQDIVKVKFKINKTWRYICKRVDKFHDSKVNGVT